MKSPTLQDIILSLHRFWSDRGCFIAQSYDVEKGAGTMNPFTFFRALGPEPWKVAYVEPSRRPADARYGDNPNRLYQHFQYQVIIKPSPEDIVDVYMDSLKHLGIDPAAHDIRLVEDNWEALTLSAWGLGWEVWLDGMEVTQFTYFQQMGGLECKPVSSEITYGLERIVGFLQQRENVFNMNVTPELTYGELFKRAEWEHSVYSFEEADIEMLGETFDKFEQEARRLLARGLVLPAYDFVLKTSHLFNVLDARGALGVARRTEYLGRIRALARQAASGFLKQREQAGYPLLAKGVGAR